MKEREDRWGHLDPAFTQMENFRGQDDPGQWTPRAEAEEKENASLSFFFSSKDLMQILEGKIAYAPFSFISFTEFSEFDQQLLQARHFPVEMLVLFLTTAPWGKDITSVFWRWGKWRSGRSTFTTSPGLRVAAGPRMKHQSYPAHVFSITLSCLPCIIGNYWPQWEHQCLW